MRLYYGYATITKEVITMMYNSNFPKPTKEELKAMRHLLIDATKRMKNKEGRPLNRAERRKVLKGVR